MTEFEVDEEYVEEEYIEEVNTSYDQDKEIGEIPSAYFTHSQPINAKNGDNFMSIQKLDEKFKSRDQQQWYYATDQDYLDDEPHENRTVEAFQEQEHPRDSDGKFSTKGGGESVLVLLVTPGPKLPKAILFVVAEIVTTLSTVKFHKLLQLPNPSLSFALTLQE